jgi:fatty-acyl-CoA synthase
MRTIVDAIVHNARGGSGCLTVLGGETAGWAQVHERARRTATVLTRRGIGPGCRVGLLGDTSLGLIVALQAVWLAGGSITMLPPSNRLDTVLRIVGDGRLDLVVADSVQTGLPRAVLLSDLEDDARTAPPALVAPVEPTDLAVLQYTSGSTSDPRGVRVTHGNLAANIAAIRVALGHDRWHGSPLMSWLPLYHDMGLIGFLAFPMSCGCPLVLQSPMAFARRPASWLEALARHGAAVTGAPNFAYRLMAQLLAAGLDADLSRVRLMLCGGEPIDAAVMAEFAALAAGCGLRPGAVIPAYGLAEATLAVALAGNGVATDAAPDGRRLVRLGAAVPGTTIRITDPRSGAALADRVVGRIEVHGPSVAGGGWLNSGDLGYLADGELVVCGREKDVLFSAGRTIHPQDAEAAAGGVPGVRFGSPIAFGVPGASGDRLIVAVEARACDAVRVRSAVTSAVLAETGVRPAEVVLLPPGRTPKTSSGKPRRAEARRRYLHGSLSAARPTAAAAEPFDPAATVEKGRSL